jgi:hypothetical protein
MITHYDLPPTFTLFAVVSIPPHPKRTVENDLAATYTIQRVMIPHSRHTTVIQSDATIPADDKIYMF